MTDLDSNRLADDDLFDDWGVRLIAVLKPLYVLYEMAPHKKFDRGATAKGDRLNVFIACELDTMI